MLIYNQVNYHQDGNLTVRLLCITWCEFWKTVYRRANCFVFGTDNLGLKDPSQGAARLHAY